MATGGVYEGGLVALSDPEIDRALQNLVEAIQNLSHDRCQGLTRADFRPGPIVLAPVRQAQSDKGSVSRAESSRTTIFHGLVSNWFVADLVAVALVLIATFSAMVIIG